jgi:hypothetical protein
MTFDPSDRGITSEQVLAISAIADLRTLRHENIGGRDLTEPEYRHIFKLTRAWWVHSGNMVEPHAVLRSFIDTLTVLRYSNLRLLFARQLASTISEMYPELDDNPAVWAVGSDHAAFAFSAAVAGFLNSMHESPEKGLKDSQVWSRVKLPEGHVLLQVEELVTTTQTLARVLKGIREYNPEVNRASCAATLVHRSPEFEFEGASLIYGVHWDIQDYNVPGGEKCLLCEGGSEPIENVKQGGNWEKLTAMMA